ncbi:MAG: hypothetical protein K0R38_1009 [Polyangiaceae bacterium]|jgi:hypothetical protein|nr:hypothetical protein [Polyangiaceae bacterium]
MSQEQEAEPTQQVVLQRIRSRIIEYPELASSFGDQREYQSVAPVNGANASWMSRTSGVQNAKPRVVAPPLCFKVTLSPDEQIPLMQT